MTKKIYLELQKSVLGRSILHYSTRVRGENISWDLKFFTLLGKVFKLFLKCTEMLVIINLLLLLFLYLYSAQHICLVTPMHKIE